MASRVSRASVRPDDSRYGDNPNRLQTHTQFQVILKPEPGNPQELFLGSLDALGIDIRRHDIRLPVPAHIYVLKCSHAFNVLDSRGAISTTERAQAFARMRGLSASVGTLWVERRRELGFPLGQA